MNIDLHYNLARLRRSKKTDHRFELVRPFREWFTGFILAILIFGIGGVYAGWWFSVNRQVGDRVVEVPPEKSYTYDHSRVEKVLDLYRAREDAFSALQNLPTPVPAVVEKPVTEKEDEEVVPKAPIVESTPSLVE